MYAFSGANSSSCADIFAEMAISVDSAFFAKAVNSRLLRRRISISVAARAAEVCCCFASSSVTVQPLSG